MVTRRSFLLAAALAPVARIVDVRPPAAPRAMRLCMHQNTSRDAGFRASLEGWSRAGIRYAELSDRLLDDFLESDTLAGARSLLSDVGVTPVCGAAVIPDLWLPGPGREANLETWRRRCDQYSSLGLDKIYCPSVTSRAVTAEDFAATPACVREAGDVARAHGLTAMIEFTRTSRHLATLTSSLNVIRAADHASVRPMLDFFHFWSGMSKLEDLDLLRPGELLHAHFQDVLDTPRELVDNDARLIPGDGVAPVVRILRALAEKEYTGVLSVELFRAEIVGGDPFEVASEIRRKCEAVMSEAGVL
jgi:sugar phosphate isomerase/epimerase